MPRPCFVVVDREFSANISTRKLILETAKFNVLTAYSGREALETLHRFPAVDGVVLDTGLEDLTSEDVILGIKQIRPGLPVVLIRAPHEELSAHADHHLDYFDPASLLNLLQTLNPSETSAIHQRNTELNDVEAELNRRRRNGEEDGSL